MSPVRAVIFDVYGTLLQMQPPAGDVEGAWQELFLESYQEKSPLDLEALALRCTEIVAEDHAAARKLGIRYPEVCWPSVMARALGVGEVSEDLICRHAALRHAVTLAPGAQEFLSACHERGLALGIASNAQPYTLHELSAALGEPWERVFDPQLSFWSFQHGFSKPDPHVFRILAARLESRRISPDSVLMIGDRPDNDIAPAIAAGFQAWLLGEGTDWTSLRTRLESGQ